MVGACQQNSGIFLVRGGGLGAGDLRCQAADWSGMPVTKSPGRQRTRSGQGPDEIPAEAEAGTGTRYRRGLRPGLGQDAGGGPRLSRQGANQLKRKRSIISSSNSGFSKSFSLVIIKLLCSKNPASW